MFTIEKYNHLEINQKEIDGKTLSTIELCCTIDSYLTVEQGIANYTFQEIIYDSMLKNYNYLDSIEGTSKFWFLFHDKNICGFVMGFYPVNNITEYIPDFINDYNNFYIGSLFVLPKYQNKKFGSKLLRIIIEYCKFMNYKQIYLNVNEKNFNALRFYKKHNFYINDFNEKYNIYTLYKDL
jgi:ribosomal protein S18 acetylase RimI-like enzyme